MALVGRFARACVETFRRVGATVIFVGSLISLVVAGGIWVGRNAGHGTSTKHAVIKGKAVLIMRESTHGLWVTIYVLAVLVALFFVVAVAGYMERSEQPKDEPPPSEPPPSGATSVQQPAQVTHNHFYFGEVPPGSVIDAAGPQPPSVNATDSGSGGTGG